MEGKAHTDQIEGNGVDPDSVRGCAFNSAGMDDNEMASMASRRRVEGIGWALSIFAVLGMVLLPS